MLAAVGRVDQELELRKATVALNQKCKTGQVNTTDMKGFIQITEKRYGALTKDTKNEIKALKATLERTDATKVRIPLDIFNAVVLTLDSYLKEEEEEKRKVSPKSGPSDLHRGP